MAIVIAQPALDSALDDLKDARESVTREIMEMRNTDISIVSALHNNTTSVLNLTVENSGSSVLSLADLNILVNGTFMRPGFGNDGFLYPGQEKMVSLLNMTDPLSVKVVGPWGISDTVSSIGTG